jgi:hypothetical protein
MLQALAAIASPERYLHIHTDMSRAVIEVSLRRG